jgi:hypothetical protein
MQMSAQAKHTTVSTRTFKRRRPSGYRFLYSRRSRWYLDKYHQNFANCFPFGSLSFTWSIISKFAQDAIMAQIDPHPSAAIPTMMRVVIRAHSNSSNQGTLQPRQIVLGVTPRLESANRTYTGLVPLSGNGTARVRFSSRSCPVPGSRARV